jgi:hypothetical protein
MGRITRSFLLTAAVAAALMPTGVAEAGSATAASVIECQHPVTTGVEIGRLKHVTAVTACPVALALYRYENSGRKPFVYGCRRPATKNGVRTPYLRFHAFDGWHMTLSGRYDYTFTFSRADASFIVGGTDFPVSCF